MREQLRRTGTPGPKVIGIDEISLRKGHIYRIVVSDLERKRAIWFGGKDRSEESMDTHPVRVGRGYIMRQEVKGASPGFRNGIVGFVEERLLPEIIP